MKFSGLRGWAKNSINRNFYTFCKTKGCGGILIYQSISPAGRCVGSPRPTSKVKTAPKIPSPCQRHIRSSIIPYVLFKSCTRSHRKCCRTFFARAGCRPAAFEKATTCRILLVAKTNEGHRITARVSISYAKILSSYGRGPDKRGNKKGPLYRGSNDGSRRSSIAGTGRGIGYGIVGRSRNQIRHRSQD